MFAVESFFHRSRSFFIFSAGKISFSLMEILRFICHSAPQLLVGSESNDLHLYRRLLELLRYTTFD